MSCFIYHFGLVFDEELIENYIKYLRDMLELDTMVDFDIKDKEKFIK